MRGKVTISDVARRARVSVGTVSHVLTGRIPVTAERRDRVTRAIEKLGYVPNVHAQGLRRATSNVVGVCFPHVTTSYLNELSEALERNAAQDGYGVLHVFSRHDPATELKRLRELIRYQVDGLILFPSNAPERALDLAHAKSLPVVMIDRPSEDTRFDSVTVDNRKIMRDAIASLLGLGHRRLLFVCRSKRLLVTQYRMQGMKAALRAAPTPVAVATLEVQDDESGFLTEFRAAMAAKQPPTAVVTSNSHQASLVLGVLREIGTRVPDSVSVLTFDDPEWSLLVQPRLSVIRQPAAAMARAAWAMLARRIARFDQPAESIALEEEIEFRESVGPAPDAAA
jgi:LacI family transcriptional regulator